VAHLVAALSGTSTERAPDGYVEKLFDDYAERFDSDLVQGLRYDVPRRLAEAVREVAGAAARDWDVLDLGCGTGLAAAAIAPCARSIVGVDLSANMLERAKARNLYRRLERADLLEMVRAEEAASYDLVLAADVFVYLGRLDELAGEVRRLLRPRGLFGFSVEAQDEGPTPERVQDGVQDYRLGLSGRYAHSRAYLDRLASGNHFDVHRLTPITVRMDAGKPVPGYLALWGAGDREPGA
jgi:predicted TPR repeat methyltransferase